MIPEYRGDKHEIKLSEHETIYYPVDVYGVEFSRGHLIVTNDNKRVAIYAPGAWRHYLFIKDVLREARQSDYFMKFMKGEST